MAHFYLDESLVSAAVGDRISITGAEARHAVTVSRLGVGESISIGNGAGLVVAGVVVSAEHTELVVEVSAVTEVPRATPAVFLAQALAKGDRDELAVQVATELGVDGVIPWTAARSISRWEGAKVAKGRDRWAAVVREARRMAPLDAPLGSHSGARCGGLRPVLQRIAHPPGVPAPTGR